jgi:hypothetical protein
MKTISKQKIFEIFKKESKIKTEKSHFCSEAAIQFYFQICTFAKKICDRIFHMTLLKLLNDLHKTQPELKVCYHVCRRGHTVVHHCRRIYDDNKGKR